MTAPWQAGVITLFPEAFPGLLDVSIIGRARREGLWALETHDLRQHGRGKHRAVDDTPAGGGPGMVLKADVLADAIDAASPAGDSRRRLCLSARGKPLDQARVRELASSQGVLLICGRFEGVDERIFEARNVEEVSIGDFVLAGGEVAAMALIEACVRLLPGVMGAENSQEEESHESGLLEYPHYTRPQEFEGLSIPPVLVSGDHKRVAKWRQGQSETLTRRRRPDLWAESIKNPISDVDK